MLLSKEKNLLSSTFALDNAEQYNIIRGITFQSKGESRRDVVANLQDCDIVVNEFELQSRYYVHFRTNTLGKGMNPLIT